MKASGSCPTSVFTNMKPKNISAEIFFSDFNSYTIPPTTCDLRRHAGGFVFNALHFYDRVFELPLVTLKRLRPPPPHCPADRGDFFPCSGENSSSLELSSVCVDGTIALFVHAPTSHFAPQKTALSGSWGSHECTPGSWMQTLVIPPPLLSRWNSGGESKLP